MLDKFDIYIYESSYFRFIADLKSQYKIDQFINRICGGLSKLMGLGPFATSSPVS